MNSMIRNAVLVAALISASAFVGTQQVDAQEVAMVYASNVMATNSLSNINATLTPQRLAQEFAKELTAELDARLPKEQAELSDSLQIKDDYNISILEELDARLIEEIRNLTAVAADQWCASIDWPESRQFTKCQ